MSLKTTTVRNLGIVAGLQLFISAMNAVTLIVLARLLTPFDFGIIGIAGFFLGFIGQFGDFGLGAAVIHRKDRVEESLQTGAMLRIIIGLIVFLVAFFSAPLASMIFSTPEATDVVRILAVTILIGSFGFIPNNALAKRLEFGRLAIAAFVGMIVTSSVSIGLALAGFSYWAIVYGSVAASVATLLTLYVIFPWKFTWKVDKQIAKELFRYGIHVFLMVLIVFLIFNLDNAAIGIVISVAALGIYFIAYRWASVFANFLTKMVNRVMFPTYSSIQEDEGRLRTGYLQTLDVISFIGAPLYFGFFIVAPEFVVFVLGDKWTPAIIALQILCLFGFIRVILQPAGDLFLAKGKTKWLSITNAVNLVIMIVFLYPAVLWGGIEGVALLVFLIYFFHTIIIYWLTTKLLNIRFVDITNTFADPLIASLGMLIVVLVFKAFAGFSLGVFAASILIGFITYLVFIYALSRKKILYYLREIMSMIRQRA
ncbi:MAG: lipopolysaccharide biosynthesis protein [Methanomassiliicoccales archaeon]|nr:MAG: lipopolysaccharide biosynthesis protein [Methanomassiliicoccales archaeon]